MTPAALLGELAALDADACRALEPITARARALRIAAEGMFDAALHAPPAERTAAAAAYAAAVERHGRYARMALHAAWRGGA